MTGSPLATARLALIAAVCMLAGCTVSPAGPAVSATSGAAPSPAGAADIRLPAPASPADRTYLGAAAQGTISPADMSADVLIIEIFSMHCPVCQREAPRVNALFRLLDGTATSYRIRMIGIGAGNSSFEVGIFRDRYQVPFPLFADPDLRLATRMGVRRTPTFLVLARSPAGTMRPVYTHVGPLEDPQAMLDEMAGAVEKLNRP